MIKFYSIIISAAIIFLAAEGCKDTITDDDIDIPDSNVSYAQHIQRVFDLKCNYEGCHNDADRAGSLSLTSYSNTTADLSIVFPGAPENSRLAIVIQPGTTNPMPPLGYYPLTESQINGIKTWIKEGAKNN